MTRKVEQPRHRVSVRTVTRGAHCQGPGRVGRDQLDLDLLRLFRLAGAVVGADLAQLGRQPAVTAQVEESGAGDLGAASSLELLGVRRQLPQLRGGRFAVARSASATFVA